MKEKIKELTQSRERLLQRVKEIEKEIVKYESLTEVAIPDLMKELSDIRELSSYTTKGLDIKIYDGKYEHILGGDGRGTPWSEDRDGRVCDIETSYYLDDLKKRSISGYLKSLGHIDKINFK